jgi:DNA excision repair protein ERCC-2
LSQQVLKTGVKDLLELLFHPKDLGTSFFPATRGQEGTLGHHLLTSQRPTGYQKEVPIEYIYEWQDYRLIVLGRIDGLIESPTEIIVEEIKTTYTNLDDLTVDRYPAHQAQLQLYLYFVMVKYPDRKVTGRLSYLNLDNLSEKTFQLEITLTAAQTLFIPLAENYIHSHQNRVQWFKVRNNSIAGLPFPFTERRGGQDELMDLVTQAIEQERDLLLEAATGIGKTIGVLYPALKQLAQTDRYSQIFFLTAKTAGKEILKKTIIAAQNGGLKLRTVFIEAKERVCLSPGSQCHPIYCPYARDYYPKSDQVIPQLLAAELITPELIMDHAKHYELCPFELSLDLSLHADLIVCDYNYVFDPGVYLRRFFLHSGRKDFLFLVDEAHNLAARGRDMYSETLDLQSLIAFRNEITATHPKVAISCSAVEQFFQYWLQEMEEEQRPGIQMSHLPDLMEPALERLAAAVELMLRGRIPAENRRKIQEFYFTLTAFIRIATLAGKEYAIYVKKDEERTFLRLFCLNPGPLLRSRLEQGRLAIFFSATLSPLNYFQELLGARSDSLSLQLSSPFPQETRLYLHVPGIDTRYRCREASAPALARCIADLATSNIGNYLIFFPSYTYLKAIWPHLNQTLNGKANIYAQTATMKEGQRRDFLRRITAIGTDHSNVGLAVLGGLFGEGIDLPGDQLVGVVIIGPGLPVISDEQELIRMYFDERNGEGFLFAYLIPGLIRVIQSAGRVFRTPDDKGVVLLVDDRFLDERYQELLPPDWFMPGRPFSNANYKQFLQEFWKES